MPVHIKGGTTDVLLYRLTMTITLAGTCYIPPSTHSVHLEYCGAGFLCRITYVLIIVSFCSFQALDTPYSGFYVPVSLRANEEALLMHVFIV